MAADPTAAYRRQQGMAPVTHSYDPKVVGWIVQAAQQTGADPAALLATSLQESGARRGAVGDNGTSFGPFQFHIGGALGNHTPAWANTYAPVLNRAQEFARLQVHGGVGAAAVQRPQDRALYAQGVNKYLAPAKAILAHYQGQPATTPAAPRTTIPAALTAPAQPAPLITAYRTNDTANIGDSLLQSLIDANARNAGIQSIQLPAMPTLPTLPTPTLPVTTAPKSPTTPTTPTGAPAGPTGKRGYVNPFAGARVGQSRVDQGVDYTIHGPIRAIADAKVVFKGNYQGFGQYVVYKLTSGPHAGRHVYISEGIVPHVKVGQTVKAGQPIATGTGGIETGWAQPGGGYLPMAKVTGGYSEGQRTAAGDSFNRLMVSLGVVPGTTSGRPTIGRYS